MKMLKPITHLLNLLGQLVVRVLVAFFHRNLCKKSTQDSSSSRIYQEYNVEEDDTGRPSPLMVPVLFSSPVMSNLIKKKLPVVEFGNFLQQSRGKVGEDFTLCTICLNSIETSQEIREPANCKHVYHRECMEEWVDRGQVTCPLCRLQLLPAPISDEVKNVKDPWRIERIAYVFGEDYVLDNL